MTFCTFASHDVGGFDAHASSDQCLRRAVERFRAGDLAEVERLCRHITLSDPTFPELARAWCILGAAYFAMGKFREAEAPLLESLRLRPDFADAHSNLGACYAERGAYREAEARFRRALELKPDYLDACSNLAKVLAAEGRFDDAEPVYRAALRLRSDEPVMWVNFGKTLLKRRKVDEAMSAFQEAVRLAPQAADWLVSWAAALVDVGRIDEAVHRLQEALRLNALHIPSYFTLGRLAKEGQYRFTPQEINRLRALLGDEKLRPVDQVKLHFCLGAVLDKAGDCAEAFYYFQRGNDLKQEDFRRRGTAYDIEAFRRFVNDQIAGFTPEFFERVRPLGHPSETPVFIVGVPRSGTTLVNQILSAHPDVSAPGELRDMAILAEDLPRLAVPPAKTTEVLSGLDREAVQGLAERYLHPLRQRGGPVRRITDKLPENYFYLGLISVLLPNARIIHCRRDPVDTCLSCYMQDFADVHFSVSLETLGQYYREYERLMAHWNRVLPTRVFEIQYEDLLDRQEAVSRDLVAYCGLEWNDACLEYWKHQRVILTASGVQVRQPIYTTARGRWRKYAAHLKPLIEALGER